MPKRKYKQWLETVAGLMNEDVRYLRNDPTYSYEYLYNNYPQDRQQIIKDLKVNNRAHFRDAAKTSDHPTFSIESDFSGKKSKYNPRGIKGGKWTVVNGIDRYTLSDSQLKHGWDVRRTIDYMGYAEDNGIELRLPNGNKAYIDGAYFDKVLPTIEVFPSKTKK